MIVDQARAKRNQQLIRMVRSGQAARDDLSIYEDGFVQAMTVGDFWKVMSSSPEVGEMIGLDASAMTTISRQAEELRQRVLQLRCFELECVSHDPVHRSLLCVADSGFRTVCHNIECVSRWGVGLDVPVDYLGEAANSIRTKRFIHTRRAAFASLVGSGERARTSLVDENMALIRRVAQAASTEDPTRFDDMFSVAAAQFIRCMDVSYDDRRPTLFTTYAQRCMTARCRQENAAPRSSVHIPHGKHSIAKAVLCGDVDVDASDILDPQRRAQEANIRRNLKVVARPISLDATIGDDGGSVLQDVVGGEDPSIQAMLAEVAVRGVLKKVYQGLVPKVRVVVEGRLGLGEGEEPKSLDRIARDLLEMGLIEHSVKRQRVGQIWDVGRDLSISTLAEFERDYMKELGVL
jgi:hypothetical protein